MTSEEGVEEETKKKRGGRTSKLVRFIERKRRGAELEEARVKMVEDVEPRQSGVVHVHHHYDLKVTIILVVSHMISCFRLMECVWLDMFVVERRGRLMIF